MKTRLSLALMILVISLAACQSAARVENAPTPEPPVEAAPVAWSPTPTPTALQASPTSTLAPALPSPSSTPSATLPPEKEALQLYSPLTEHTIEELSGIVSSPYNPPPPGDDARHHGVDFCYYDGEVREFIEGEGIQAIFSGLVAASQADRFPYGNMVIIETLYEELPQEIISGLEIQPGESLYHLYAHFMDAPEVGLGERVEGGQTLGQVGKTGYNIGVSHLHFETRIGPSGAVFESMAYYDVEVSQAEMDTYEFWRTSRVFRHFDPMELFLGTGDGGW